MVHNSGARFRIAGRYSTRLLAIAALFIHLRVYVRIINAGPILFFGALISVRLCCTAFSKICLSTLIGPRISRWRVPVLWPLISALFGLGIGLVETGSMTFACVWLFNIWPRICRVWTVVIVHHNVSPMWSAGAAHTCQRHYSEWKCGDVDERMKNPALWPGSSYRLSSESGVCSSASGVSLSAGSFQSSGRSSDGFFNGSYLLGSLGSSVGSSVPGSGFEGTEPFVWSLKLESVDITTSPMMSQTIWVVLV